MTEDCVTLKLPHDYVRRMRNWAKWMSDEGVTLISSIYQGEFSGRGETRENMIAGEAVDTHKALAVLQPRELQAVTLFWIHERPSMEDMGRRLRCSGVTAKKIILNGCLLHIAELQRMADAFHRQVERNQAVLAQSTAHHGRTGSVTTRTVLPHG